MWTNHSNPFTKNHTPVLTGWASDNSNVSVPVAVDPATGSVLVDVSGGSEPGLIPFAYDYIAYTNTSTTIDTYTYKEGGAGGTTVATITITYTDTTKTQISTVART